MPLNTAPPANGNDLPSMRLPFAIKRRSAASGMQRDVVVAALRARHQALGPLIDGQIRVKLAV
jgi:hypothetical protein